MIKGFFSAIEHLHNDAKSQTGLDDFGSSDYLTGLEVLLKAYDSSAQFSELGKQITCGTILNCLKGRLYFQAATKNFPDYSETKIENPIFIIGLPRSGTTFLHRLLCQHPSNQGLENWLGSFPQPRPPRSKWSANPRYLEVEKSLEMYHEMNPEIKDIHEMAVYEVDECRLLLMHCFANVTFQSNATIPAYEDWLYSSDFTETYEYFYRSLQLIGYNDKDKRWVLKDPSHMWSVDYLFNRFPDATIVQIHRHPKEVIPSVCSLVMSAKMMSEPSTSPILLGHQQLEQWASVLEKTIEIRKKYSEKFIDIFFHEIVDDPLEAVRKLYISLGEVINRDEINILDNFVKSDETKNSKHKYTPEEFGLTDFQINDRFSEYIKHYGL